MAERLKRIGTGTILLPNRPGIAQTAAIVGKKEGSGPLHGEFDAVIEDDLFGEETWEKAESRFHYTAANTCLKKAGATPESVDVTLGGDLLNQIMAASTAAQKLQTPFLGIYGACSTMAETLCIGAMLCDGGYARRALCCASSHFCSAERQYRFPLEYGNQRPPTSQWTVTGAGAALLDASARRPICRATHVTLGRIVDLAIKDMNNMGAAMAPAAADTLRRHLMDTGRTAADYDLIISGDLGKIGHDLLLTLMMDAGVPLDAARYVDCGCPRGRFGLRMFRERAVRVHHASLPREGDSPRGVHGDRGAAIPDIQPAGRCDSGHCPLDCTGGGRSMTIVWNLIKAFLVGGALCMIGEILLLKTKLTPARILVGVFLSAIGVYAPLAQFAGAGASVPLTGFGHALVTGVKRAVQEIGILGAFTGGLTNTAAGISAAVFFGVLMALIFQPRAKE